MGVKRKGREEVASFCADEAMQKLHRRIGAMQSDQFPILKLLRSIQKVVDTGAVADQLVDLGLLEVLPLLLNSQCEDVLVESLEVIGALAVSSYQMTCKIVSNDDLMKVLVDKMAYKDVEVNIVACKTALELAITEDGKEKLQKCSAVGHLMSLFSWSAGVLNKRRDNLCKGGLLDFGDPSLQTCSTREIDVCDNVKGHNSTLDAESHEIEAMEELFLAALDTANVIVSSKTESPFEGISENTLNNAVLSLKHIWQELTLGQCDFKIDVSTRRGVLAKLLVQLATEGEIYTGNNLYTNAIQRSLFKGMDAEAECFFGKYWEQFPVLMTRDGHAHIGDLFSLLQNDYCKASASELLEGLLAQNFTCPPVSADELNFSLILKEVEDHLGRPMIYDQDIRLVKSVPSTEPSDGSFRELHYSERSSCSTSDSEDYVCAKDCMMAFEAGYSVALRGMQFRSSVIAGIADALALTFGQASVGVNLYLTPRNSQGFALHYDDHCVVALQLSGLKKWRVYASCDKLPQLYSHQGTLDKDFVEGNFPLEFVLERGDVLYIPRGFPHEAQALSMCLKPRDNQCLLEGHVQASPLLKVNSFQSRGLVPEGAPVSKCADEKNTVCTSTWSLHLTFGVEVEFPFTWEGLIHISLHDWRQSCLQHPNMEKATCMTSRKTFADPIDQLCAVFLHIAIRLIGRKHESFRNACLVAARPFQCNNYTAPVPCYQLDTGGDIQGGCLGNVDFNSQFCGTSEKLFFSLIDLVRKHAEFHEAYKYLQEEIHKHDEHFLDWMRWLRHLPGGFKSYTFTELLSILTNILQLEHGQEGIQKLKQGFEDLKLGFVQGAFFGRATGVFLDLLQQYRTVRKRFVRGMLALHTSS